MTTPIGAEAQRPNPALEPPAPLVGTLRTTGTHPLMPGTTFHGRTSVAWHEGGAFLVMRSEIDEPGIPSAVALIGSDDVAGDGRHRLEAKGSMSRDGAPWEDDLQLTYERIEH